MRCIMLTCWFFSAGLPCWSMQSASIHRFIVSESLSEAKAATRLGDILMKPLVPLAPLVQRTGMRGTS